jgi:poly(beta-D-mannuronate) lyase
MAAAVAGLWLLASPAAAEEQPGSPALARPGEVLFARDARRAELAAMTPEAREALCGVSVGKWRSHGPVKTVSSPDDDYGGDERGEPFAHTVMRAAAAAFGLDDEAAQKALVDLLDRWARGPALLRFDGDEASNYYVVDRIMLPTLVAWSLVRDSRAVDKGENRHIVKWLAKLIERRDRPPVEDGDLSGLQNHDYLAASVDMAWGALVGDSARFGYGLEIYRAAIGQMRADGSFPRETERGARALWYQRHAVASLVTMAEMAAVQGHDLYGYAVDGHDIHSAIRFLLAAVDDPKLVWPYAEANINPGPYANWMVQDMGFLVRRGHGRHYMAWAEPYMRRFPDRIEAKALARLLPARDPDWRPMVDEYSGGDTTCFFAPTSRQAQPAK